MIIGLSRRIHFKSAKNGYGESAFGWSKMLIDYTKWFLESCLQIAQKMPINAISYRVENLLLVIIVVTYFIIMRRNVELHLAPTHQQPNYIIYESSQERFFEVRIYSLSRRNVKWAESRENAHWQISARNVDFEWDKWTF